ncbi:hypothetical protein [Myroides odoratimimus]|uniref:Uncharacterized protein n=1 Tax=Myroides odoratimimus TaxID=76832 RepID=A0AAI8C8Q6_9FLAO|nr:hypothetical protein [Myroides odoratimimus]ALU28223.1 hypothetical protein AS202_19645 [Myroides odoratimimus]MDM1039845.1 hypothetical protein [Myroides odoratimimus]MDM1054085.1 hypothetical protein [Myroides odoratimimus]
MAKIDINSQIGVGDMILEGNNHPQKTHFVKSIKDEFYTLYERGARYTFEITLNELITGDFYLVERNF